MVDMGSSAPKTTALLGNHCTVTTVPYGNSGPYIQSGEFNALACLGNERNPFYPDIPCTKELGINADFEIRYVFLFPKDTPDEIVQLWNDTMKDIIENDESYKKALGDTYYEVPYMCSSEEVVSYFEGLFPVIEKYLK
jgi:tripartite-type tricarboxylate transporter receptor subunit TctC